jgi:hypothetical protein
MQKNTETRSLVGTTSQGFLYAMKGGAGRAKETEKALPLSWLPESL